VSYVGGLELRVTKLLGDGGADLGTIVVLKNPEDVGIDIDGYVIRSPEARLAPGSYNGLKDQLAGGWSEINLSSSALTELNLTGSSVIAANSVRSLGAAFLTGGATDLTFKYNVTGAGLDYQAYSGTVSYVEALRGDANGDGVVDIFDVNVISDQWDTAGPGGDVNFDGVVDIFDVNVVSDNWDNSLSGGANAVPEPASLATLALSALIAAGSRARSRRRS
jgi:hypothetical protein